MAPRATGPSMEFWIPITVRAAAHTLGMTNKPALLGELIYWATWMFPTLRSSTVTEMLAEVDGNVTAEINNIYCTFNLGSRSLYHIHNFMIADLLKDFRVLISETGFPINTSQFNTEQFHLCGQFPGMPPAGVKSRVKCPWGGITGRYVYITLPRIAVLTLCQVEIYGRKWAVDQNHQNSYSKSNIMWENWIIEAGRLENISNKTKFQQTWILESVSF